MKLWYLAPVFLLGLFDWGPALEKSFGRMADSQMKQEYGYATHPLLVSYVEQIGEKIARIPERKKFPYRYYVVRTEEENAFAAGAGYQFVTRGILQMAETEDEIAFVMGHETAHNADKHVIQGIKDQFGALAIFLLLERKMNDDQEILYGLLASLRQLRMSRKDEYRADQLGVYYAARSGYNPYYAITLFEKLERTYPTGKMSQLEVAFSSHPRTPDRMERIREEIQKIQNSPEGLKLGENLVARGYPVEAIEFLGKAPQKTPEQLLLLARAYSLSGNEQKAQETAELARAQNPSLPPPEKSELVYSPPLAEPLDVSNILLALDAPRHTQSLFVSAERKWIQESLNYLDQLTQSAHKPALSSFQASVATMEELLDLYLRDQTTLRLIEKTQVLMRKTRDIPTQAPFEFLDAQECFLDALRSLQGKNGEKQEVAQKARDDIFAFQSRSLSELKKQKKEQEEYWKRMWKCSLTLYAIRVGDIFAVVEQKNPGMGLAYLQEKTELSASTWQEWLSKFPRAGFLLAAYSRSAGRNPIPPASLESYYQQKNLLHTEQEPLELWTFYNLMAGDLLRMLQGPFYSPGPRLELIPALPTSS